MQVNLMSDSSTERARIRTLLEYDDIIGRPFWFLPMGLLQFAIVIGGGIWFALYDRPGRPDVMGYNILEGILAGTFLLILTGSLVYLIQLLYKAIRRMAKKAELSRLEANARKILKNDYKRALKAILRASQLKPSQLTPVSRTVPVRFEQLLFSDEELSDFLGPLETQSIRSAVPQGVNPGFLPIGRSRYSGDEHFNALFVPFRVTCIIFSTDSIILGEAVCDPSTGKIQRRVRTLARESIQSADFQSTIRTLPITRKQLDGWLQNRRLDREERARIRKTLTQHDRLRDRAKRYNQFLQDLPYAFLQKLTAMDVVLKSGQHISLPLLVSQKLVHAPTTSIQNSSSDFEEMREDYPFSLKDDVVDNLFSGDGQRVNETAVTHYKSALWSTGRQSTFREFSAVWSFIRSTFFAVMLGVSIIFLMTAVTSDWTERGGSTDEDRVRTEPR
ncbi:MAG: hypothetical protein CMK09_09900 [Ponticaulis sp.]|nr:hypothetical protein [Ponticaulis sp.]|tara:strand:- start:3292 stop:4629 length:1338 start_codon:yes stop_codon:yes gene_type:complete